MLFEERWSMKIWVVASGSYRDEISDRAFTTLEKAKAYYDSIWADYNRLKTENPNSYPTEACYPVECELDEEV